MPSDETGRKGGRSFTGQYDTDSKTARPTSVGPHHARDKQEDPGNPGIKPEEGYGAEIARNNEAAQAGRDKASHSPDIPVKGGAAKGETADESGATQDMAETSGPARDAPPLTGTVSE